MAHVGKLARFSTHQRRTADHITKGLFRPMCRLILKVHSALTANTVTVRSDRLRGFANGYRASTTMPQQIEWYIANSMWIAKGTGEPLVAYTHESIGEDPRNLNRISVQNFIREFSNPRRQI